MRTLVLIALCGGLLLAAHPASAAAADAGACSVWKAKRDVKEARRTVARAERRLAEAKRVLSATKVYSGQYGSGVGRWTRLARRVDWPWSSLPTLMLVIDRESGGDPHAKNPCSSASGLLQLMSCHWAGKFDPFAPKKNLSCGLKLYRGSGWAPWSL